MSTILDIIIFGGCGIIAIVGGAAVLDIVLLDAYFINKLRRNLGVPEL